VATNTTYVHVSVDFGGTWRTTSPLGNWSSVATSQDGALSVAAQYAANSTGGWGQLYAFTSHEATWKVLSGANVVSANWVSITMSGSGTHLLAAPKSGHIISSADSGVTWNKVLELGSTDWAAVACSVDGTMLVAAEANGGIFTNSGGSWSRQDSAGNNTWYSLAVSSDGSQIIAGAQYVFMSVDFGVSWYQTTLPLARWGSVASSHDGANLVAAQSLEYSATPLLPGFVYTSGDYGNIWTQQSIQSLGPSGWVVASSASGTRLVAGPTDGLLSTAVIIPSLESTGG